MPLSKCTGPSLISYAVSYGPFPRSHLPVSPFAHTGMIHDHFHSYPTVTFPCSSFIRCRPAPMLGQIRMDHAIGVRNCMG